jgi:hypothetical protein
MITREIYLFAEDRPCAVSVKIQRDSPVTSGDLKAEGSWLADQGVVPAYVREAQGE